MMPRTRKARRMLAKLIDIIVDWWLKRCPHAGDHVAFDILEGDCKDTQVQYCRRCGAVRICHGDPFTYPHDLRPGEWRRPQPTWFAAMGGPSDG